MKLFKLSFLFLVLFLAAACGDDDEGMTTCTQADWVGTYTGTISCDGETPEDVTFTILAGSSDGLLLSYETASLSTEFDQPIPFQACNLSISSTDQGLTLSLEASRNGDNLTFTETITVGGDASICTITATKD
jgi:hypothetical protein